MGKTEVRVFRCALEEKGVLDDGGLVVGNTFANGHALGRNLLHITDGTSATAFAFECSAAWKVAWLAGPMRFVLAPEDGPTGHRTALPVLLCDGGVRLLKSGAPVAFYDALLTPNGGESVQLPVE